MYFLLKQYLNKTTELIKGELLKNTLIRILSFAFIIALTSCSDDPDPKFRIHNERLNKANVQLQTSGGNTININDVEPGQVTAYQSASIGNITVTAVIQNESVSPTITFNAVVDENYTIVIQTTNPPSLRVDR
jgi:hypothetical protein